MDAMERAAQRYVSSGRLEVRWVERKQAREQKQTVKTLRALCKEYNGHREYMVAVVTTTGSTFTNVEPCGDDRFTGLQYYPAAAGNVTSGQRGTFLFTRVKSVHVVRKTTTIKRR